MQMTIQFQPGLTAQFPELEDLCVAVVYGSRKGLQGVAADLDMSPSELSKRLANHREHSEPRPLRTKDLVGLIRSTGDVRPIHWLIEEFLEDPDARAAHAMEQFVSLMHTATAYAEQAGLSMQRPKKRAA